MFAYCLNNPVGYQDPHGFSALEDRDTDEDPLGNNINDFTGAGEQKVSETLRPSKGGGRNGLRRGLQKLTGQNGTDRDAHHVFPVKFEDLFRALGIDIHNPQNGAWWESHAHHQNSYGYNLWWDAFFSISDVTAEDAFALADFLSNLYGFVTNYEFRL